MKIAQIAPPWIAIPPPNYGGTKNVIFHLVEELIALGHDVRYLLPETPIRRLNKLPSSKSLIADGVLWQASLKPYYHLHKSIEYVREHDFDIVHTHLSSSANMYIFPLLYTFDTPHVTTMHSHFSFDTMFGNWTGDADTYFMEWAQQVPLVAISESARSQATLPVHFAGMVHYRIQMHEHRLLDQTSDSYFIWLGRFVYEKGRLSSNECRGDDILYLLHY